MKSPTDTQDRREDEVDMWSDPLVGLQVDQFRRYLDDLSAKEISSSEVLNVAEYLCEWSRSLLNRTYGRTTQDELEKITDLFAKTAQQISEWAQVVEDPAQSKRIESFELHIQQRTGLQRG